jgi:hypothetical protein
MREIALGNHTLVAASLLSASHALRKLKRKKQAQDLQARAEKIMTSLADSAFNNNRTIDVRLFRAGN